ncbi:hypothetical protein [Nocardioides sp. Kera G14]|uniref:hypothetical protein n=1 Tax=Nocardioides sp. Kera G14 TaxID=2884264 RepID=UPI001D105F0C|nr:hypothetical protein [Nocardioides sp. Kera G14]UDY24823.1 hypothetical protein LH076_05855 [Nocardioides sp. Kera G14]
MATLTQLEQLDQLRERMRRLERAAPQRRALETLPVLRDLVQLQAGGVYEVDPGAGGASLTWGLLAGPTAAGEWGAVVGVPDFGAEAAAALGVRLERVICVPEPGEAWLEAVAALVDVASLIVVRPPTGRAGRVSEAVAGKLAARLRTREAALISLGPWPRAEVRLTASAPRWGGAGQGDGHLRARLLSVEARRGTAPARRVDLWFPAADLTLVAQAPREEVAGRAHLGVVAS